MVFSSLDFLFVFLPITLILYYLMPSIKQKNTFLIIASLIFYAYGEPVYIGLMLISILGNYYLGRLMYEGNTKKKKIVLIIAIIGNLSVLVFFKYTNLFVETWNSYSSFKLKGTNYALPIGISFYTFQAMSYVIDVYRGRVKAERRLKNVMLYVALFPQLIAGPIVKYHEVSAQIKKREINTEEIAKGLRRFIVGLGKKVIIANTCAKAVDYYFRCNESQLSAYSAWIGAIAYMLQIYFDFSGYSDMAIGLGHMFGFKFLENFNYPYISNSIKEFWHRWHISLSTWFKEYLYIPLGGNRKGKFKTGLNKMIVFAATGIWHGANWTFLLWGIYHGLFLLFEDRVKIDKIPRFFQRLYALIVVAVGFVLFRADSIKEGLFYIKAMFFGWDIDVTKATVLISQLNPFFIFILIIGIIGATPWWHKYKDIFSGRLTYVFSLIVLFICVLTLSSGGYNPFIYFRF